MKKELGFTLVEILIVISVIGILIGIMIPRFKGMQEEANRVKAKSELKTLQTATESWFMHQNPQAYPATSSSPCATYFNTASPLIISTPIYDPFAAPGTEYNIAVSPAGAYYVLWSQGPYGSSITGIGDDGNVIGAGTNDIYVSNGN